MTSDPRTPKGTLGGSNRMLSSRDVTVILAIPERTDNHDRPSRIKRTE